MKNIYNYTILELEDYFKGKNEKPFRAIQIYEWLYKKRISSFDEMNNIKKEIIIDLKQDFIIKKLKTIDKKTTKDVYKYLFDLEDNNKIEAVLLKQSYGNSLCISTQVGCNMGCLFCESGRLKKQRNLNAAEMVMQILEIENDLNLRISHIVLMGIGEPFDNYDNVIKFLRIINNPKGINIGARHITISTCGIVPKIEQFINDGNQVNLAISLHASNDKTRDELMPINKVYNLDKLMNIIKKYITITNRRVTFEYIMLKDINDSLENALELVNLIQGINCYVNLIPYNATVFSNYQKSESKRIMNFYKILKENKINVTIRKELGSEVMAACGQLRANYEEEQ